MSSENRGFILLLAMIFNWLAGLIVISRSQLTGDNLLLLACVFVLLGQIAIIVSNPKEKSNE
jgi:hypothetical protein